MTSAKITRLLELAMCETSGLLSGLARPIAKVFPGSVGADLSIAGLSLHIAATTGALASSLTLGSDGFFEAKGSGLLIGC